MEPGTTLAAGRFRVEEWLGEGSGSVVYAALDLTTGREVAIKLARATAEDGGDAVRGRLLREAAALSVIVSEHVVELIAAGRTDGGQPFLVLERLRGRDLEELVAEIGPLEPPEVVRFLTQAAAALELAHGLGIVHRDLKPANLFVHVGEGQAPVLKVLDFSMAVDVTAPTRRARDAFGGTPLYMAPEQVRGQLTRLGPASDVWSLALVAVTLLTGETYWPRGPVAEVLQAVEHAPLEPPSRRWPWLGKAFDGWLARALERVPERRFRGVAEQIGRLDEALRQARRRGGAGGSLTPTPTVLRPAARHLELVGRDVERTEIARALVAGRLVTVTGPGGVGKTCLVRSVADALGDAYPDGAWVVPVPPGTAATVLPAAIAAALELRPEGVRAPLEHVAAHLARRQLLVVLDGLEQAIGGAAPMAQLLAACPSVSWLASARVALGLDEETSFRLEPLDAPPPGPIAADEAATFPAVALLVGRIREAQPDFRLGPDNVDDVVGICRAVEGLPLGLELAAARAPTGELAAIRAAFLERGPRDAGSAIRAALEWSYALLADEDQRVLRHLAPFPAGLGFASVRALLAPQCADPAGAVLRLVQSNLLAWSGPERRTLVMPDSVRELCDDLSHARGEDEAVWALAHRYVDELVRREDRGVDERAWLERIDAEYANLRAVLAHLLDAAPAAALRLAGELAWYWYLRGRYAEGTHWLESALARAEDHDGADDVRARQGAGHLALLACRYERARRWLDEARARARRAGDARGEARAVQLLGSVARERGEYREAERLHRVGLAQWERLDDAREAARARNYLVFAAWLATPGATSPALADDLDGWWRGRGESELARLGDAEGVVWALLNQGAILHLAAARDEARATLGRAFATAVAARFDEGIAWALELLGRGALARGELLQAAAQLTSALRVHRRLGDRWRCASALEGLAAVAVAAGRAERGAQLLGVADGVRADIDAPVPACERALLAETERRGRAESGAAFESARARTRGLPVDAVEGMAGAEGLPAWVLRLPW